MERTLLPFFVCFAVAILQPGLTSAFDVPEHDANSFGEFMEANPLALVMFYAPWCGHCKQFEPQFQAAAEKLKDNVPLIKVDISADINAKLGEEQQIAGFPTIKLFREGKATLYGGERTTDAIVDYMQKRTGPPVTNLNSIADVEAFKNEHNAVIVSYFRDTEGANFKEYEIASRAADDVPFGNVMDAGVRDGIGAQADSVVMYKKFDEAEQVYTGGLLKKDLTEFAHLHSLPKVIQFNEQTAPVIFANPIKTHLVAFFDDTKDAALNKEVAQAAGNWLGTMLFIHIVPSESQIMDYFGVKEAELPALRIVDLSKDPMRKFHFNEPEITGDAINEFVQKFADNKLEQKLRSEAVPEKQEEDVRVVVTDTFTAEVIESEKDVLVEFYAPWCSHCSQLKPEYDALAASLKEVDTIVIAKVNAETNELPSVKIEGFPTIKLWAAGKKDQPVNFQGERNEAALLEFIKEHATHKWFNDKRDEL